MHPKIKAAIPIKLSKGDLFRVRWDFVPGEPGIGEALRKTGTLTKDPVIGKGLHINAEFGIGAGNDCKNKIAFMPAGVGPVVDPATARNPDRFDQIVRDQSTFLAYDIKPNTPAHVFTLEERLHPATSAYPEKKTGGEGTPAPSQAAEQLGRRPTPEELKKINEQAARRLAERWAEMVRHSAQPELSEPIRPRAEGKESGPSERKQAAAAPPPGSVDTQQQRSLGRDAGTAAEGAPKGHAVGSILRK